MKIQILSNILKINSYLYKRNPEFWTALNGWKNITTDGVRLPVIKLSTEIHLPKKSSFIHENRTLKIMLQIICSQEQNNGALWVKLLFIQMIEETTQNHACYIYLILLIFSKTCTIQYKTYNFYWHNIIGKIKKRFCYATPNTIQCSYFYSS